MTKCLWINGDCIFMEFHVQTEFVEVAKLCATLKIKGLENYSIGHRELQIGSYNKTTKNPLDSKKSKKYLNPLPCKPVAGQ